MGRPYHPLQSSGEGQKAWLGTMCYETYSGNNTVSVTINTAPVATCIRPARSEMQGSTGGRGQEGWEWMRESNRKQHNQNKVCISMKTSRERMEECERSVILPDSE